MIRSLCILVFLVCAVLWAPLWFQLTLFVLAVVLAPYKLFFLLPAILADILYAPTSNLSIGNFTMTLIVGTLIGIWFVLIEYTRLSYVVEA